MDSNINIAFMGDLMPGGVLNGINDFISKDAAELLSGYEIRVATLECAIGDNIPFDEQKMADKKNVIWAPNADIDKLRILNINVVTLANNHVFDLGYNGLKNTLELLDKMGVKHCGAGMNKCEAMRPAVVEVKGKTVAFLAYCQHKHEIRVATENDWGITCLEDEEYPEHIKMAKRVYDYVFVLPHWGIEVVWIPPLICRERAMKMIESGADGVIGNHPHQIQPIVHYKQIPIVYSLGNFLFPNYYMQPPRPIWYPDKKIDLSKIKKTYGYPFRITEPHLKIWKDFRNISLLVIVTLSDRPTSKHSFLKLVNEKVTIYKPTLGIRVKMKLGQWVCKTRIMNLVCGRYHSRIGRLVDGLTKIVRGFNK